MKTIYQDNITKNIIKELEPSLSAVENNLKETIDMLFKNGYNLDEICSHLTKIVVSETCRCDLENAINLLKSKKEN